MEVLSYIAEGKAQNIKEWWARQDSNLQQHGYEPWVLTN